MVLKSSFIQRVKLKGDCKKGTGESFQFDLFFWMINCFKSVLYCSVVLLISALVEHEEVHSKHFIDFHKWIRQVVADNSSS